MKAYSAKVKNTQLPILVERDEDGVYVAECPLFRGCYSQGDTLDEAFENVREVVGLVLQEKEGREILKSYKPREVGLHTIAI